MAWSSLDASTVVCAPKTCSVVAHSHHVSKTYGQWVTPSHPVKSVRASFWHFLVVSFSIPGLMGDGEVCQGAGCM